jgi:hypothetical protein
MIAEVFVIIIMIIILLLYIKNHFGEVEYVKADDNKSYLVRNFDDKQEAANFLANITTDLLRLVQHMMAKYPENDDVQRLYNNFNPSSISEGSVDSGYTSYSINKGEKIILCIRQKDKSFVPKNTIMYVAIHELGHLMTNEIGHTDLFWKNFKFLLKEAIDQKLYYHEDYREKPQDYCGIKITSSIL